MDRVLRKPVAVSPEPGATEPRPIRLGIAGIGGYAEVVTDMILKYSQEPDSLPIRLHAVADPMAGNARHAHQTERLHSAGIDVRDDFELLLDDPKIDVLWLPVPIHLHREFTERAFASGKHVLCEKPLAGSVQDVKSMIRARDASGCIGMVGFHDLYHPQTRMIKQRLLDGEIGELRAATVIAAWPRDTGYYQRTAWAGLSSFNGVAVRDNPVNNALAHYLMLGLFFLGSEIATCASPVSAEAETWRAARIKTYDTVNALLRLSNGRSLRLLLTHAAGKALEPQVYIHGERGTLAWTQDEQAPLIMEASSRFSQPPDARARVIEGLAQVLRHPQDALHHPASFENALEHIRAVEMIDTQCTPNQVPQDRVNRIESPTGSGVIHEFVGIIESMIHVARGLKNELS